MRFQRFPKRTYHLTSVFVPYYKADMGDIEIAIALLTDKHALEFGWGEVEDIRGTAFYKFESTWSDSFGVRIRGA